MAGVLAPVDLKEAEDSRTDSSDSNSSSSDFVNFAGTLSTVPSSATDGACSSMYLGDSFDLSGSSACFPSGDEMSK
jgi:hypothetical protein